jgi:hypothetical protein
MCGPFDPAAPASARPRVRNLPPSIAEPNSAATTLNPQSMTTCSYRITTVLRDFYLWVFAHLTLIVA